MANRPSPPDKAPAGSPSDQPRAIGAAGERAARPASATRGADRQRPLSTQARIGRPRSLLLDEPLISLDPRKQRTVVGLARRLCRELKITVLFSPHELNQL